MGVVATAVDLWELVGHISTGGLGAMSRHSLTEIALRLGTHILALVGGVFVLRGHIWARWLCVAWMGFHVVLSLGHPWLQLTIHAIFFVALLWFLIIAPKVSKLSEI